MNKKKVGGKQQSKNIPHFRKHTDLETKLTKTFTKSPAEGIFRNGPCAAYTASPRHHSPEHNHIYTTLTWGNLCVVQCPSEGDLLEKEPCGKEKGLGQQRSKAMEQLRAGMVMWQWNLLVSLCFCYQRSLQEILFHSTLPLILILNARQLCST